VLPTAMRVQQGNRGDTLIDQDGSYFLEAIRRGAQGLDELTQHVYEVNFIEADPMGNIKTNPLGPLFPPPTYPSSRIVGALSTPYGVSPDNDGFFIIRTEAKVHALSGSAVEKDPQSAITFDYLLTSEVNTYSSFDQDSAFGPALTNEVVSIGKQLHNSLHEVRLTFRWPYSSTLGLTGNNKKVFRALVSGSLVDHTNELFFFESGRYGTTP
jgi:hypothetical protein